MYFRDEHLVIELDNVHWLLILHVYLAYQSVMKLFISRIDLLVLLFNVVELHLYSSSFAAAEDSTYHYLIEMPMLNHACKFGNADFDDVKYLLCQ